MIAAVLILILIAVLYPAAFRLALRIIGFILLAMIVYNMEASRHGW